MSKRTDDIMVTQIDTIKAFDLAGDYLFTLDELQDATIANSEEKEDITGKGGRKLSSIKRNKAVTISGNNGMVSGGLLELQTGGTLNAEDKAEFMWEEYAVINENASATTYKAIGTEGAEINSLRIMNSDGTINEELEQSDTADTGKYTYDPKTKAIAFKEGDYKDGTEIKIVYKRYIKGHVLENQSDQYSTKAQLYIDAEGEDKCGNVYYIQFYVPKADFNGTFDVTFGSSQSVHAFEAESMSGGCGSSVGRGMLWRYTVVGANAEDAE